MLCSLCIISLLAETEIISPQLRRSISISDHLHLLNSVTPATSARKARLTFPQATNSMADQSTPEKPQIMADLRTKVVQSMLTGTSKWVGFLFVTSNLTWPRLLDSDLYSDVTLQCEGHSWKVHRVILSISSEYFARMFESRFMVSS